MIGILCPSAFEYRALRSLKFSKKAVSLRLSGMGKVRVLYACHLLRLRHPKLKAILLVGFAGGLTSDLKVGDLIEPGLFVEYDYDARPFERYPHVIKKSGPRSQGVRLFKEARDAVMLTQDRFLKENPFRGNPKSALVSGKKKPLACDMESYALAYFCENSKIKYSAVKLISDVADAQADHDFLKACRALAPKFRKTVLEALCRMQSVTKISAGLP